MKAISSSNFFALLCLLTIGFHFETAVAQYANREECVAAKARRGRAACPQPTAGASFDYTAANACETRARNSAEDDPECLALRPASEARAQETECRSLLNSYDETMEDAIEQCSRMNVGSIRECQSQAARCSGRGDVFNTEGGFSNLMTGIMQINMGATQSADGCYISDDDRAARERERIDDRISRLRDQISDDKEDANKADEDLNKKRREVEEDMAEVEEDFNKKQIERQTKSQEDAAALQKQILEAEKRRRNNANQIAEKTVQMANVAFDQQQAALEFAQSRVDAACNQRLEAMKEQQTMTTVNGQRKKKKLTAAQANQVKRMLEAERESCYREVALGQQRKNKEILDKKNKLQREIDELEASSADELKAIDNQRQSLEQMKTILDQEEAKELEVKMKKLDSLNKSVTDMEQSVQRRKQIIAERILSREQDIQRLVEQRNNVQQRFAQVSSDVSRGSTAARNFVGQCCGAPRGTSTRSRGAYATSGDVTGFGAACSRVTTDYDVRPSTAGGSMGGSGTGR